MKTNGVPAIIESGGRQFIDCGIGTPYAHVTWEFLQRPAVTGTLTVL